MRFAPLPAGGAAAESQVAEALSLLNDSEKKVALLVGCGAAGAREEVLETARRLQAPMVITLKAKPVLERDNEFRAASWLPNPCVGHMPPVPTGDLNLGRPVSRKLVRRSIDSDTLVLDALRTHIRVAVPHQIHHLSFLPSWQHTTITETRFPAGEHPRYEHLHSYLQ